MKNGVENSQRIHFNRSEVKQSSDCGQRFNSSSSEVRQRVSAVKDFILIVVKLNSVMTVVID